MIATVSFLSDPAGCESSKAIRQSFQISNAIGRVKESMNGRIMTSWLRSVVLIWMATPQGGKTYVIHVVFVH